MNESAPRWRSPSRFRKFRLLIVGGAAVAVVAAGVWALFFSTWFRVDEVRVSGVAVLSVDEVLAAAAVPPGRPLIRLDSATIAERVAALPPVDEVSVSRQWPHTVVIDVVERKPALAVPSTGGFAIYDPAGVPYQEVIAAPDGVPRLATDQPDDLAVDSVLAVLADLPASVRERLVTVRAETADSIELDLTDGVVVVWGSAEQNDRKAEVLAALMKQPGRVYIVSAPDAPAIRP
jgi:cell division protein FtsQ